MECRFHIATAASSSTCVLTVLQAEVRFDFCQSLWYNIVCLAVLLGNWTSGAFYTKEVESLKKGAFLLVERSLLVPLVHLSTCPLYT